MLLGLLAVASPAWAQGGGRLPGFVGGGSTAPGDYLRGVGIAAAGMGSYNLDTAQGIEILNRSAIQVDSYLAGVYSVERQRWLTIDREQQAKIKAGYAAIQDRLLNATQMDDVIKGRALNATLYQLNDKQIQESSFRSVAVKIPIEDIRKIRFQLGAKGVSFSMRRLTGRVGTGEWPIALQDPAFTVARREFDKALDSALEHVVQTQMPDEVIKNYEAAVQGLRNAIDLRFPMGRNDVLANEAREYISNLRKNAELFKIQSLQPALAELDRYSGSTVDDLRQFMLKHNLQFAPAELPDERTLYPSLYVKFKQVYEVVGPAKRQGQ
jgi:hypothetical protein